MTKNLIYTVLLSLVNILFPVLSFPYASHILGPVGIGKVQLAISFAQYFAMFAALGIPIYGIKATATNKADPKKLSKVFTELTTIFFIGSLLLFSIYSIIIFSFPFFSSNRQLYISAGILVLLSFSYTDWFFAGIEEYRGITLRSVIIKSISLVLLYIFVKTVADFNKYLFIIVFSILGNQIVSFIIVFRKVHLNFANINLRKHVQPLLYLFSATLAASIYTILDTVLLGFLSNEKAVGLYTASVKIVKLTIPFVISMGVILIPSISKSFSENDVDKVKKNLEHSFIFLVFMAIPIGLGLAILAPELILIFSGKQFKGASASMQILCILPLLIGFGHFFCFQILMPMGKNKEIFFSMLTGVFTCFLLNFILVPFFAEIGASIANIATELMVTCTYFYFTRKYYSFSCNWKFILQSVISSTPFIPIVLLFRTVNINMYFILILSLILCVGSYIFMQLFIFKNIFLLSLIIPLKRKFFVKN